MTNDFDIREASEPSKSSNEKEFEKALRPLTFDDFQGQDKVCFQVTPKTGANKVTEFFLCADEIATGSATYAKLEGGKYYVLHPNPVTELSGVSFSLNIPAWECGLD